jgi:hypothetical protein
MYWGLGQFRWGGAPWGQRWLEVVVPDSLVREKTLFLSLQQQSLSALSVRVHPSSGFVNLIGQQTLESRGPQFERLMLLRRQFKGRIRTLYAPSELSGRIPSRPDLRAIVEQSRLLARYGLSLDSNDCVPIEFQASLGQMHHLKEGGRVTVRVSPNGIVFSCAVNDEGVLQMSVSTMDIEDAVMAALELKCAKLFRGEHAATEWRDKHVVRYYADTDMTVSVHWASRKVKFTNYRGVVAKVQLEEFWGLHVGRLPSGCGA